MRILVINGPNLNLLGMRKPALYGVTTLPQIHEMIRSRAAELGVEVECVQHNCEGDIIDAIHSAIGTADGIVINPGGYTHTSIAIRDAYESIPIPVVEVHLTNIHAREDFRAKSMTGGAAKGIITGLGPDGYLYALDYLVRLAREKAEGQRE